jgi:hypothetical protein
MESTAEEWEKRGRGGKSLRWRQNNAQSQEGEYERLVRSRRAECGEIGESSHMKE